LIDILNPDEEYNAALFAEQSRSIIADLLKRKKIFLLSVERDYILKHYSEE